MAFVVSDLTKTTCKHSGARLVAMASILSIGVLGNTAVSAAGLDGGAWVSLEGLDDSAAFVSFEGPVQGRGGALPTAPQDLTVLLDEVESILGNEVAGPVVSGGPEEVEILVAQAHALVAPILGAMGGGTIPGLAGLSLEGLPLGGFGAGGGGAPLALPGLEGLDASLPVGDLASEGLGGVLDGALGDPLNGVGGGLGGGLPVGGVLDGVSGGLPTVPVVGGLLGQ